MTSDPPTAVVADDSHELVRILENVLSKRGFVVRSAHSGDELIDVVRSAVDDGKPPDVVVSDVYMPGRSGLEAVATLRPTLPHTRFVLVSAYPGPVLESRVRAMDDVVLVPKPFDVVAFAERIEKLVER